MLRKKYLESLLFLSYVFLQFRLTRIVVGEGRKDDGKLPSESARHLSLLSIWHLFASLYFLFRPPRPAAAWFFLFSHSPHTHLQLLGSLKDGACCYCKSGWVWYRFITCLASVHKIARMKSRIIKRIILEFCWASLHADLSRFDSPPAKWNVQQQHFCDSSLPTPLYCRYWKSSNIGPG